MPSAKALKPYQAVLQKAAWWIVAIGLSPILVVQTLWAMRRTPSMPEPAGSRSGTAGDVAAPIVRLLVLGDSSAAGVGVAHQDEALLGRTVQRLLDCDVQVHWQLIAKIGAETRDAITYLQDAKTGCFDVVVIGLGVNDATHMVPERRWIGDTKRLLDVIDDQLGHPLVLVSGFPPVGRFPAIAQPLRAILGWRVALMDHARQARFVDVPNVIHMPFNMPLTPAHMAMDGFHPGPEVYDQWAAVTVAAWDRYGRPAIDAPHTTA